ncbi:Fic family protein [Phenylobacterium sp.]|uniref:Fic family protein n=1 Tax=Phenylobacterium sp. TaxID=1871053 RepID=UPI0039C97D15
MVADTGEPHSLLKPGELEAACAHPINQWHYGGERSPSVLAVGLMVAVGRAHPFVQGNKRTAFAAAQLLLYANDFFLDVPDIEFIADELRRAMTGETPEYILVVLFEEFLRGQESVALPE